MRLVHIAVYYTYYFVWSINKHVLALHFHNVSEFLEEYNTQYAVVQNDYAEAEWNYETNITDKGLQKQIESDTRLSEFRRKWAKEALSFNLSDFTNQHLIYRQLNLIRTIGIDLNSSDKARLSDVIGQMSGNYGKAKICGLNPVDYSVNCSVHWDLEPDITNFIAKNRNYDALLKAWRLWHDAAGKPVKKLYEEMVKLSNKGAKAGGFNDTGKWWKWPYELPDFDEQMERIWFELLPLYEQLHAYVRKHLRKLYAGHFNTSAIPAHILGNIWAQDWSNLKDLLTPYPKKLSINVTEAMLNQNYTVDRMFHLADDFFVSLGLKPATRTFWEKSMLVKPKDHREVICHASAFDMCKKDDFRIKMCTEVDMDYLQTIHHELGHIQYYRQYENQPAVFREGANPGFHEAIGDVMTLSVSTPEHLEAIGLLQNYKIDDEQDMNYLMDMALTVVSFLPFGYLVDKWRYNIFDGTYADPNTWNDKWWELKYQYQGLINPHKILKDDFDPGAKFHVSSNTQYMIYFTAFILKFQFYQAMCKAANYTGPFHHCDFYQNKAAGKLMGDMMSKGSSIPWPDALQEMTGQRTMNASALLEYFKPLNDWLIDQNKDECFGWGQAWPPEVMATLSKKRCPFKFE